MKKSLILLILTVLTLTGCLAPYYTGVDFVRNIQKENPKQPYFKESDVIYFSNLTPSSVIYFDKDHILDANKEEDLESYQRMIDYWNLEEKNNYGYDTPSLFLSSEYNINMSEKFNVKPDSSFSSTTLPIKLELFSLESFDISNFKMNVKKTNESQMEIAVIEPKNVADFSELFSQMHPDATHVILANSMIITCDALTYSVSYNAQNVKFAGTILVSKSIIDLDKKEIVGYDLNQTPIFYSYFEKINTGLRKGFGLEGTRLRKYF
ncbi:MAG: hypothetical protein KAS53_10410 [Candidatus Cloacimonetes bacterium]|nr:hypothetical protein [Candidatus Cloacimonadota bacterium]